LGTSKHRDADIVPNGLPNVNIGRLRGMERDRTPFGARMFQARTVAGLTQMEVKGKLKISQGTLSELEHTANSSGRVVEFARLYGCDADWLATGERSRQAAPELAESEWPFPGIDRAAFSSLSHDERLEIQGIVRERMERFLDRRSSPADTAYAGYERRRRIPQESQFSRNEMNHGQPQQAPKKKGAA
jgi:transcriptional regulator with XRE-family HTH domain